MPCLAGLKAVTVEICKECCYFECKTNPRRHLKKHRRSEP